MHFPSSQAIDTEQQANVGHEDWSMFPFLFYWTRGKQASDKTNEQTNKYSHLDPL